MSYKFTFLVELFELDSRLEFVDFEFDSSSICVGEILAKDSQAMDELLVVVGSSRTDATEPVASADELEQLRNSWLDESV